MNCAWGPFLFHVFALTVFLHVQFQRPHFLIECENFFEENFFAVQSHFFHDGMYINSARMGFELIGKMLNGR